MSIVFELQTTSGRENRATCKKAGTRAFASKFVQEWKGQQSSVSGTEAIIRSFDPFSFCLNRCL